MTKGNVVRKLVQVTLVLLASSCNNPKTSTTEGNGHKYYFVTHGGQANDFWNVVEKGMNDAATKYGVTATYLTKSSATDVSADDVATLVQQAIAAKPDGIAVTITDATNANLLNAVKAAVAAGIAVTAINAYDVEPAGTPQQFPYDYFVGQHDEAAGYQVAQRVLATEKAKGTAISGSVCVEQANATFAWLRCGVGSDTKPTSLGMTQAVVEAGLSAPDIVVLDGSAGDSTTLNNYFSTHPDTNYVQATAAASLAEILALNLQNKIIASFDTDTNTISALKSGTLLVTVDQQPYLQGYLPIVGFELKHSYALKPGGDIPTGPFFIDSSNVDQIAQLILQGYR